MKARIQFDGGCKPNPGQKYGSYRVEIDDAFNLERNRFPLGFGTNNEAEFESLILALTDLQNACARAGVASKQIELSIFTDSTIVRGWLHNHAKFKPAKCKNARRRAMGELAGRCIAIISSFKSFKAEWNPRAANVETFGH